MANPVEEDESPPEGAPRSPSVSGVVVDEEGNSLPGVTVRGGPWLRSRGHWCRNSRARAWEAVTGPGGAFEIQATHLDSPSRPGSLLETEGLCMVYLDAEVPADAGTWAALESGLSVEGLRIVRRASARLYVEVAREDGMPVPGARVRLLGPGGDVLREDDAGERGCAWFGDLDPRREYHVEAEFEGFRSGTLHLRDPLAGGESAHIEVVLPGLDRAWYARDGRLLLAGVVVDGEGRPLPGARVGGNWIRGLDGTARDPVAGDDGRFEATLIEIPGPDRGVAPWDRILCEVRAEGFGTRAVVATRVHAAALGATGLLEGLRIVLRPGAAVAGRVLTPEGEVIPDATIEVTDTPDAECPPTAEWERIRIGTSGAFRFSDLDPEGGRFLIAIAEGRRRGVLPLRGRLVEGRDYAFDFVLEKDE